MKTVNPRERRAPPTIECLGAYDGCSLGGIATLTLGDGVENETGDALSSSQVEILIENGLRTHIVSCIL